jgi:hypothetical protein
MTGNQQTGNRILGSLRSADGKGVVRVEHRFDTDSTTSGRRSQSLAGWPAGWAR